MTKEQKEEIEQITKELHEKIEKVYGKEILEKFKSDVEDKEEKDNEIEMLKVISENAELNFALDQYLDENFPRLYIYPDGKKNQRESITVEYNKYSEKLYVSGHGENTSTSFVCNITQEEAFYCILAVINIFRKDNEWDWKMPCETRKKNEQSKNK